MNNTQENPLEVLKTFAGLLGLIAGLFSASGLLAVRAQLSGLGISSTAALSVDAYLQEGGRFIFSIVVHLIILTPPLYLLYVLFASVSLHLSKKDYNLNNPAWNLISIIIVSMINVFFMNSLLSHGAAFVAGQTPNIMGPEMILSLYGIELILLGNLIWFWMIWPKLKALSPESIWFRPLPLFAGIILTAQLVLFPTVFGRVAMIPKSFDEVEISDIKNNRKISGLFIYSDQGQYFIWKSESKTLMQVAKNNQQVLVFSTSKK